jgi:hypothetical protein
MHSTNKEFVKKFFVNGYDSEYELTDYPYLSYEIHIGKRSGGWKPLFKAHKNAYNSVKEMIDFLKRESANFEIFDEYGEKMSVDELQKELIDWGKNQKAIDHVEYAKNDEYMLHWHPHDYWSDDDGYNFTNMNFS